MKILFLSVPTGGGHHQAAKAIREYFSEYSDVECRVLDVAENVNNIVKDMISKGYILSTTFFPKIYGSFYNILDAKTEDEDYSAIKLLSSVFKKQLKKYLDEYKPDIIVSTHCFATIILNKIAKKHPIGAKIISIVTDYTVHPWWEQTKSDYYITASEFLSYQAIKKLGTDKNVLPLGIPVHPKFSQKGNKNEIRKKLKLDDRFTVLVMMGSMGFGNAATNIVKQLGKLPEDIQIIAVCGKSKRLKSSIQRIKTDKKVIAHGFVDNVDELMDASDCIITKPGGLSTSEALAKNLPLILTNPIPGQEDRNMEFMLNHGVAISLSDTHPADEAIYLLMHFPHIMERLRDNARFLAKPDATKNLGEFIIDIYKTFKGGLT